MKATINNQIHSHMKPIKEGDKIYAVNNSAWGMVPMKVKRVANAAAVTCKHPDFSSDGWFSLKAVERCTPERAAKLRELSKLIKQVDSMKKDLFGLDRG